MLSSPPFRTPMRLGAALSTLAVLLAAPAPARAAFGYTDNGTAYVVDTGAGLVFQVDKSSGTLTSIVFNGVEYNGPSAKGSHIASELGTLEEPVVLVGASMVVPERLPPDLLNALGERRVDGRAGVVLDRGDQEHGRGNAGERHGGHRGDRDAGAQAARRPHGRSTQPTPRIVCSTRGSPSASSLRRR